MKRTVIILFFLFLYTVLTAQVSFGPRIMTGFTTNNQVFYSNEKSSMPALYLNAGVEVQFKIAKKLSLHSGLFYEKVKLKNSEIYRLEQGTAPAIINEYKVDYDLNYISIPVIAVLNPGRRKGLYAGAGLSFSYGLRGELTQQNGNAGTTLPVYKLKIKIDGNRNANDGYYQLKKFNTSLSIKGGYKYHRVWGGINANLGISNLSLNPNELQYSSYSIYIYLLLGKEHSVKK